MPSNTKLLKEEFKKGNYQELLRDIYVDENVLEYQRERYIKALERFETLYGEKEVEIYSAPGRSEVGGNHTDHQYGNVFSGLYNDMKIDEVLIAQVGQYAENVFFGKPCGLMDQMASAVGGLINIDFKDPKKPMVKQVNVDFEAYGHSLCIVDTKGSHADLTDDYAAIPEEMKQVANFFEEDVLRKVDKNDFYLNFPKVREILGDRAVLRAMHLFEENKRVDEQVEALEKGDFETFKKLVKASGDSSFKYLQNVYSNHEINNQSMSIGLAISDVVLGNKGVSRVHGGGFAGTIQAFIPNDIVGMYKETVENVFGEGTCHILKVRKYGGMKVL